MYKFRMMNNLPKLDSAEVKATLEGVRITLNLTGLFANLPAAIKETEAVIEVGRTVREKFEAAQEGGGL